MTLLSPVSNPISLEKQAFDAIKDAILTFRLNPGESIVENELAKQLGISKTPVRDALGRLEKEGFIIKIPYKGYYVQEITREDVANMFEIRAALEGLAARQAAPRFSKANLFQAQAIITEHNHALSDGQIEEANQLNRQFHQLIVKCSGNERLDQMLANLDDHLQRYRTLSNYQSGRLMKSVDEHQHVLDALLSHDPDKAERATREHILSVLEDLESQDFQILIAQAHERSKK